MPPAATIVDCGSEGILDVGGIEVEQVAAEGEKSVVTRISLLPREPKARDDRNMYTYLASEEKCLAYSFDSVDEIDENSNEAKLIKSIAQNSILEDDMIDSSENPQDPYLLDETEARYLDVLDKHIEETDPDVTSFADLEENEIDDSHPKKKKKNDLDEMDVIVEHLLDSACCQCNQNTTAIRPLKSALKTPKWTAIDGENKLLPRTSATGPNSVKFNNVDIRLFQMTLGDHPSACSGPPVRLDWDTQTAPSVVSLEEYEGSRQARRHRRQLKLSLQQRHNILVRERGFSFEEVKGAWHDALEIRKQRKETLERGLALMKFDEVWESTCRKFNRLVDGTV